MALTTGLIVGSAVVGGVASAYGAKKSADSIEAGTNTSIAESRRQFDLQRADIAPYIKTGTDALSRLDKLSKGDSSIFTESPDYQFNLEEGQQAIDRSLAARGKTLSGQGVKEGVRYASGMASREFGSFFDRLSTLAGIGQTGAAASAAAGSTSASQVGNAAMAGGQGVAGARMSGAAGVNNAATAGLSNWMLMNYLGKGA